MFTTEIYDNLANLICAVTPLNGTEYSSSLNISNITNNTFGLFESQTIAFYLNQSEMNQNCTAINTTDYMILELNPPPAP